MLKIVDMLESFAEKFQFVKLQTKYRCDRELFYYCDNDRNLTGIFLKTRWYHPPVDLLKYFSQQ